MSSVLSLPQMFDVPNLHLKADYKISFVPRKIIKLSLEVNWNS